MKCKNGTIWGDGSNTCIWDPNKDKLLKTRGLFGLSGGEAADAERIVLTARNLKKKDMFNIKLLNIKNSCEVGFSLPIWEGEVFRETFCRCPDNGYGFTCRENFPNVCLDGKQYHKPHESISTRYFIECNWKTPYLFKCPNGTVWNDDIVTCEWGTASAGLTSQSLPAYSSQLPASPFGRQQQQQQQQQQLGVISSYGQASIGDMATAAAPPASFQLDSYGRVISPQGASLNSDSYSSSSSSSSSSSQQVNAAATSVSSVAGDSYASGSILQALLPAAQSAFAPKQEAFQTAANSALSYSQSSSSSSSVVSSSSTYGQLSSTVLSSDTRTSANSNSNLGQLTLQQQGDGVNGAAALAQPSSSSYNSQQQQQQQQPSQSFVSYGSVASSQANAADAQKPVKSASSAQSSYGQQAAQSASIGVQQPQSASSLSSSSSSSSSSQAANSYGAASTLNNQQQSQQQNVQYGQQALQSAQLPNAPGLLPQQDAPSFSSSSYGANKVSADQSLSQQVDSYGIPIQSQQPLSQVSPNGKSNMQTLFVPQSAQQLQQQPSSSSSASTAAAQTGAFSFDNTIRNSASFRQASPSAYDPALIQQQQQQLNQLVQNQVPIQSSSSSSQTASSYNNILPQITASSQSSYGSSGQPSVASSYFSQPINSGNVVSQASFDQSAAYGQQSVVASQPSSQPSSSSSSSPYGSAQQPSSAQPAQSSHQSSGNYGSAQAQGGMLDQTAAQASNQAASVASSYFSQPINSGNVVSQGSFDQSAVYGQQQTAVASQPSSQSASSSSSSSYGSAQQPSSAQSAQSSYGNNQPVASQQSSANYGRAQAQEGMLDQSAAQASNQASSSGYGQQFSQPAVSSFPSASKSYGQQAASSNGNSLMSQQTLGSSAAAASIQSIFSSFTGSQSQQPAQSALANNIVSQQGSNVQTPTYGQQLVSSPAASAQSSYGSSQAGQQAPSSSASSLSIDSYGNVDQSSLASQRAASNLSPQPQAISSTGNAIQSPQSSYYSSSASFQPNGQQQQKQQQQQQILNSADYSGSLMVKN